MGFCRQMHNAVRLMLTKNAVERRAIAYIDPFKFKTRILCNAGER